MALNHKSFITSRRDYLTFLHRYSNELTPKILKQGLFGGPNLQSTATFQPRKLDEAENIYNQGKTYGQTIAVIQIPIKLWQQSHRGDEFLDDRLGYWNNQEKDFAIKPEFVTAIIDRNNDKVLQTNHVAINYQ